MRERKRDYELLYIISPLHADDQSIATIFTRIQDAVQAEGGEVTAVNHTPPWGRRRFAYPLRAYAGGEASRRVFTEGFYVLTHFSLPTTRITSLERTIKLTAPILRYLITVVEPKPQFAVNGTPQSDASSSESDGSDDEAMDLIEEDME